MASTTQYRQWRENVVVALDLATSDDKVAANVAVAAPNSSSSSSSSKSTQYSASDIGDCNSTNSASSDAAFHLPDDRSRTDFSKEFLIRRRRMADLSHAFVFPLFILQTFGIIVGPCLPPTSSATEDLGDDDFNSSSRLLHNKQVEKRLCHPDKFLAEMQQASIISGSSGSSFRRSSTTQMFMRHAECRLLQRVSRVLNPFGIALMVLAVAACMCGLVRAARDDCRVKVGVTYTIIQLMWIVKQLAVAFLLRRAWNGPLKEIVWKWRTSKCICILKQQIMCINHVSIITFSIGLALTALNILIQTPLMFKMIPDSYDLQKYFLPPFSSALVNRLVQSIFLLGSSVVASYCYMVPCLIVLITYVLCKEFDRVNELLALEYDRERRTLNVEVSLLRSWHQNICFLVDKCDESFSNIIAVTAGCDIFNAVFLIYQICDSYTTASTSVLLAYTYWTVGHVGRLVVVSLMCARVHEAAHRPLSVLFNISAMAYAPRADDHNARLELLLFTGKLSSTLRIGITAGGVVTLTRNAVTSLVTFLLTLVLVMFQLKQNVF